MRGETYSPFLLYSVLLISKIHHDQDTRLHNDSIRPVFYPATNQGILTSEDNSRSTSIIGQLKWVPYTTLSKIWTGIPFVASSWTYQLLLPSTKYIEMTSQQPEKDILNYEYIYEQETNQKSLLYPFTSIAPVFYVQMIEIHSIELKWMISEDYISPFNSIHLEKLNSSCLSSNKECSNWNLIYKETTAASSGMLLYIKDSMESELGFRIKLVSCNTKYQNSSYAYKWIQNSIPHSSEELVQESSSQLWSFMKRLITFEFINLYYIFVMIALGTLFMIWYYYSEISEYFGLSRTINTNETRSQKIVRSDRLQNGPVIISRNVEPESEGETQHNSTITVSHDVKQNGVFGRFRSKNKNETPTTDNNHKRDFSHCEGCEKRFTLFRRRRMCKFCETLRCKKCTSLPRRLQIDRIDENQPNSHRRKSTSNLIDSQSLQRQEQDLQRDHRGSSSSSTSWSSSQRSRSKAHRVFICRDCWPIA